jgi:hypothetical protein
METSPLRSVIKMTMSYGSSLTIEYHPYTRNVAKIKTALRACFGKILSLINKIQRKKVTLTTDLPLNPFYLTETHEFEFRCVDSHHFTQIYHCAVIVMREEFRVAKMAVKFELRRLTLQNV